MAGARCLEAREREREKGEEILEEKEHLRNGFRRIFVHGVMCYPFWDRWLPAIPFDVKVLRYGGFSWDEIVKGKDISGKPYGIATRFFRIMHNIAMRRTTIISLVLSTLATHNRKTL